MFGLFGKESELDKLNKVYKKLLAESYKLSHTSRAASDKKAAEAHEILTKIDSLRKN